MENSYEEKPKPPKIKYVEKQTNRLSSKGKFMVFKWAANEQGSSSSEDEWV